MSGFSVNFKDFNKELLSTKGPVNTSVPEGVAPAKEIAINYLYPIAGEKDVEARLIIECPVLKTSRGIVPPKLANVGNGKPAIAVSFDVDENDDHKLFVGSFGTKFDYVYDKKSGSYQPPSDPKDSTGVLGSIYDWCILQYAKYNANIDTGGIGGEEPGAPDYNNAVKEIGKDSFFHRRRHASGENKGRLIDGAKPMKFFKLMTYRPGTAEENCAKFYLPNKDRVSPEMLRNQSFVFIPFLSFRRIFIGEKVSVTMEMTECVIIDILESVQNIPTRSNKLIDRLYSENPKMAEQIAEKFALMKNQSERLDETPLSANSQTRTRVKVEEDSDEDDLPVSPPADKLEEALKEIVSKRDDTEVSRSEKKPLSLAERLRQKPSRE